MLSINTIKSGIREKEEYYTEDESLKAESESQENYYSTSETQSQTKRLTQAVWYGKGAKQQGLEGHVQKADFKHLFHGFKPGTEIRIRAEKPNPDDQERLAEDFSWSAPKSVSMTMHLNQDWRLFDAHMESLQECLDLLEARYATTRIQQNGERRIISTDNLTIALIPHHTSRDRDMQVHTHAVIMNGTQGPDGVWRSLHNDAMSQQGWLGNLYRQKLAHKVQALGYEIYQTKDGFELKGLSREKIQGFSKRSRAIIKHLEQKRLEVTSDNRDHATLVTRKAKYLAQTLEEYQQGWKFEANAMGVEVPQPGKSQLYGWVEGLPERS